MPVRSLNSLILSGIIALVRISVEGDDAGVYTRAQEKG